MLPNAGKTIEAIRLCAEEALANVVMYAFPDQADHQIAVLLRHQQDSLFLTILDDGLPFDPTAWCCQADNRSIESATIGGRGILLMRHTANAMSYVRQDGRNQLTLQFRISRADS